MDVAIVGGGLAGLVAAFDLMKAGSRVAVFDDATRAGGQARTQRENGLVIEDGAEGWVAADTDIPALCRDLGIAGEIIPQRERRSLIVRAGVISELSGREAAALLGIPLPDESAPGGLCSLRNGMGSLADTLVEKLTGTADVHARCPVTGVEQLRGGWRVTLADGRVFDSPRLVIAAPPPAAAALLEPLDLEAAALLRTITLTSNVCVSLALPRAGVAHDLAASGLVIAPGEQAAGLRACVFTSSKFGHRTPDGTVLLRTFFRPGPGDGEIPDKTWVDRATAILAPLLGISGRPSGSWVVRWPDAIPQYAPGHEDLVSRIRRRLDPLGGVYLAGAAYLRGGMPGAVRSGRELARALARPLPD